MPTTDHTDNPKPRARWRWAALLGLAVLIVPGWLFVLAVNRWHVTAPTVLMLLSWAALVLTGFWATRMAMTAAKNSDNDDNDVDWFRARGRRDELEREKKSLLKAIKEIEFDRETAKISQTDAADLIVGYRAKAIEVIKALETLDRDGGGATSVRERIEAEVRARMSVDGMAAKAQRKAAVAGAGAKPEGQP